MLDCVNYNIIDDENNKELLSLEQLEHPPVPPQVVVDVLGPAHGG